MKQPRRRTSAMTRLLGGVLACLLGAACSSGGRPSPAPIPLDSTGIAPRSRVVASECSSGEVQDCSVPLGVEEGDASNVSTQTYDSDCDEDTRVQWGFFTYETTTPGDSNVRFRIRTANTEDALAAAQWVDLATAHASPNTQRCSMGGPAPCPIDLYDVLGGTNAPAVHHKFAQVAVTLTPSSDQQAAATVQGWHLDYSCPFIQ